ncbi:hypothetical protein EYD10_06067 [Varanus komodoensis]|nr:hypothetical protein EYD10_06067 [Varanus komodoensis]
MKCFFNRCKMSGKNLQEFNAMHRSSSIDKMVVCVKAGLRSSKYKPVDYEQLHAITEAKKLESANILFKIKKTEYASKFSKEQMLLKQHKQVWWKEHKRLHESRQKLESEMQTFFDEGSECVLDLWDLRYKISEELDTFQANTVQPVWQLREDLRYRLLEMQTNCKCPDYQFNPDAVLKEVEFVKKQQKVLLEKLHIERITLEEELEESTDEVLAYSLEERFALFHEIPSQLLALECPYPDLKASVLTGFHKLAGEYWLKFQEIDQKLQVILRAQGSLHHSPPPSYPHNNNPVRITFCEEPKVAYRGRFYPYSSNPVKQIRMEMSDWLKVTQGT